MVPPQPVAAPAIEAAGLAVRRGGRLIVEGIDFSIATGEALLLRGPNGAGKTTLLLTIFGAIRPSAGTLAVRSGDPDARRETLLHLLGHRAAVKARLTVAENLGFWAALNGQAKRPIDDALDAVGLGALGDVDAGHLSAGQTRRLALARLLVSERPIWLLDEPTASLDTTGETLVAGLIDEHCAAGGVAIAATHHDIALKAPTRSLLLGASR